MPIGQPIGGKSQFDLQREKAGQRATAAGQQQGEAIRRRFASMGALNSGAAIKQQELAEETANQQKEEAIGSIDAAEAQDLAQKQERQSERDFTAGEAEKHRGFLAQEGKLGRDEARLGREFTAAEAEKQRGFVKAQSDADRAFQDKIANFDQSSKLRQLDLSEKQFSADQKTQRFNKAMALLESGNLSPDALVGIAKTLNETGA